MERGLVTLGVTARSRQLLIEAAEHAIGADAPLIVLSVLTEEQAEHDLEVLDRIGDVERVDVGEDAEELALELGERITDEVLGDYDVEYRVVGQYLDSGDFLHRTVEEAEERDCDHVFMLARRRTGLGGLFGRDRVRQALEDFDGFATVGLEHEPENRFVELRHEDQVEGDFVRFYQTYL